MADLDLQIREGGGHPDPEIREGGGQSQNFFSAFRVSVWSKNRGRGLPLDPLLQSMY